MSSSARLAVVLVVPVVLLAAACKGDPGQERIASAAGDISVVTQADGSSVATQAYTVVSGDSLWAISQQFCTSVPVLVQLNGLDSTKEMKHLVGLPKWMAQRGVSSLVVDQPGTGEALRLQGLTARFDAEHWASRVVDYLESRDDVDPQRIGCEGVSLGGYYCPRVVAMEPRFAAGVCWGANHDWRDVQKRRLEREGDFPVPHYWAHVCWVWGARDIDDFMRIAEDVHLDGVVEKIRVPFLVTHGERDSQIPLKWAHRTYEQLVNSPQRELKVFTDREGGVQHASFDNSINAGHYIADWMARALGGRTA